MSDSRWSSWSRGTAKRFGFNSFTEAAMPSQDPAEKARQMGLVGMPFGWFKDPNTGQLVARSIGGELVMYDKTPTGNPQQQPDVGNPTVTMGGTPADRARQMGLQSDGSGNYVDQAGNTVARTVNNELVFYDPRGSGGAVSDGAGGMALTQSAPSWVDPVSGLIIVPPAAPESPEEINAVPDPTPATPPMGYDRFIEKKRMDMHQRAQAEEQIQQDIGQKSQKSNEVYQSSEQLQGFKQEMDGIVQSAMQQGGDKAAIGSYLMDHLADNAEQIAGWYELLADNPEADDIIITHAIDKARWDWYTENHQGDEEKMTEHDVQFTGQSPTEVRPLQKKATDDKIRGLGEKTADDFNDSMQSEVGGKFKEYQGQFTDWEVYENEIPDNRSEPGEMTAQEEITSLADEVLSDTGFGEASTQVYEIGWGNKDLDEPAGEVPSEVGDAIDPAQGFRIEPDFRSTEGQSLDDDDRMVQPDGVDEKTVALDSLATWRSTVLPDMPIGAILYSNTVLTDQNRNPEVRARIYKLAGFGDYDEEISGQVGVVTMDERGKKKVMPINRAKPVEESFQVDRINEQLMSMLDGNLNTEERESLFSALFDGFI